MKTASLLTARPQVFDRIAKLLWVIVLALAIAFCFLASSFCITMLLATFLSILIDPLVSFLERWRVPRSVSSSLLILPHTVLTIAFRHLLRHFLPTRTA